MASTEELEAQILAEMESNPEAYAVEENNFLLIDNDLRTISIPEGIKNLGVESDDDVHRLYFKMPKTYGEFDLSTFDIRINYKNWNIGDVYAVEDKNAEGDVITFSWLVGRNAVRTKGATQFIVCLKKSDASGVVQQEFNTTVASLNVLEGLETAEKVIQANADIIEQILKKIDGLTSISQEDIANAVAEWMQANPIDVPKNLSDLQEDATHRTVTDAEKEQWNKNTEDISSLSEEIEGLGGGTGGGTSGGSGVYVPTFLNGLKYYAFGDSIVDNQGTTASPKTFGNIGYTSDLQGNNISEITVNGYIQAVEKKYGLVCSNFGASGHTLTQDISSLVSKSFSDVALVTIAYGVNDARLGVPLGDVNSTDITTFAGCLNVLLRKIYTDNPECRVIVLTPIQRLYVSDFGIATPNANGNYLIDFVDMCKKVAQKRSTRCIDMYRDSGINQTNLYYYTVEGVHPLNPCYLRMAMPILKALDEMTLLEFNPFGTMTNTGDTEPEEPDTGGDGGGDNPPEEEIGATEVDVSSRLTKDGYYYDGYTSVIGRGSYSGIELPLIELIEGKTYTLETYTNGNTDSRYAAVSIDENASNGTYLRYGSTDTDGNWVFTLVADGVYKASITWVAGEQKRNVSGVQTPCLYLSFGCLKGYEEQAKLSYV